MAGRVGRIAAATAVVAATGTGAAMIGVGTADAANPLIAGKCGTALSGTPGQAVMLNTASVTGGSGPTITLGTVPQSGSQTFSVPTTQLSSLVSGLPLLGGTLSSLLGGSCDVTVSALNQITAPVRGTVSPPASSGQSGGLLEPVTDLVGGTINGLLGGQSSSGGSAPASPAPTPVGSGSAGGSSAGGSSAPAHNTNQPPSRAGAANGLPFGQVPSLAGLGNFRPFSSALSPSALYGNLPFVTAGMFRTTGAGFGNQVPGFSPQFGMLDQNQNGQSNDASDPVQNAGKAEALHHRSGGTSDNGVGLPLLVAVLALSGVTATLVRTWVLRHTAS